MSGGPSIPPGSTDDVVIGGATITNQPSITSTTGAVTIASYTSEGSVASTLTIVASSTGSLTTTGNLTITQTVVVSTIKVNNRTLTVQGNANIGTTGGGPPLSTIDIDAGTFQVNGTVTANSRGKITFTGTKTGTVKLLGDYNQSGTYTPESSTLLFDGSGAQAFTIGRNTDLYNFSVGSANAPAVTMSNLASYTLTIAGNLTVNSGTLDLNTFSGNRTTSGGTLTVSNGATLKIGSTNTFPANYTTRTLGATGTVDYAGTSQTVTAESYGHLTLSGSGTKTMPASAMTVAGNFSMSGTATATALAAINTAGSFTVGSTASFTSGSFTHDIKGDFSNSGTFTATGSTITLTGTADQAIGGSTTTTFNNLTVNKASGAVTVSTTFNVSGTLTFTSGNISTGSNKVVITSTGSVSRTSGHVVGNLQKNVATGASVSRTFEVGDASNYTPVSTVFASVSVAGDLTASTTAGDHPNIATSDVNPAKSVNRYWTMSQDASLAFTNYDATFNFVGGDLDAGANTSSFVARRYSGGSWSSLTMGTRTATSTQITGATAFGDFQVGNVLSVSVSNSVFAFGGQPLNTWLVAQSSVITNDGTESEAIVGKISTFTAGANTWTLSAAANGADQVRAQWSTTSASGPWTDISTYDANFTISSSLAASGTVTLYFRIQTPTSTASFSQYSSNFTVTAQ